MPLDAAVIDAIAWALNETSAKPNTRPWRYILHRNYYDGLHRLLFADQRFKTTFGDLFEAFADNLCPAVVDAVVDRLVLQGFDGTDGEAVLELFPAQSPSGQARRFRRLVSEVHLDAVRLGDEFVMVWPDVAGQPVFWPQLSETIAIEYDTLVPGKIKRAAKVWLPTGTKRWRVNLYYPDRIERFISRELNDRPDTSTASNFVEYEDPNPLAPGAVVANPWGRVPIGHFAHKAPTGGFGQSELSPAVPIQDALNKSVADMLVGSEFTAFPQRYGIGVGKILDPTTGREVLPFKAGVESLWTIANPNAQFGQFPAADLEKVLAVVNDFRVEMGRTTGTPLHYFQVQGGNPPAGVALDRLESRLVKKVEGDQDDFGEAWVDLFDLGLRMAGVPVAGDIEPRWDEAAMRDESAELDVAQKKKDLGIPPVQIFMELGYTQEQAEEFAEAQQAAADAAMAASIAAFDRGQGSAPVVPAAAMG